MLSVGCGPFPWRLPDCDSWEDDFLANLPHKCVGAWHIKDHHSEEAVLDVLYAAAPLHHKHTEWRVPELHEYIKNYNYNHAWFDEQVELAVPPVRQLMQIFTMAYEDLLAREDPRRGYASPWSTMGVHPCQASAYHPVLSP